MNKKEDLDELISRAKEFGPETQLICEFLGHTILFLSAKFKNATLQIDELRDKIDFLELEIRKLSDPVWRLESADEEIEPRQ